MLTGVALPLSEVPLDLIERHHLEPRLRDRGGERELWFLWAAAERLLPVWHEGKLQLLRWGNRRGESRSLPTTAWARLESFAAGTWAPWRPVEAIVPATLGLDGRVWYRIRQGVRALVAADEHGLWRVFPLVEPATHYYKIMTRADWAPCLLSETI